jgi:hypothetical protein
VARPPSSDEHQRITCCAALSLGWEPGAPATPSFEQAKAFWYQWFMATDRGADVVRRDGKAFAGFQWESWNPHGWFDDAVFNAVAESLKNPYWPNVTWRISRASRPLHRPPSSRPSNGSFSFDNLDLKSTRTLLSQLDQT